MNESNDVDTTEIRTGVSSSLTQEIEPYIDHLSTILREKCDDLLQVRKLGVVIDVPVPVRDALVSKYGQEGHEWLAKIDGRVWI